MLLGCILLGELQGHAAAHGIGNLMQLNMQLFQNMRKYSIDVALHTNCSKTAEAIAAVLTLL